MQVNSLDFTADISETGHLNAVSTIILFQAKYPLQLVQESVVFHGLYQLPVVVSLWFTSV